MNERIKQLIIVSKMTSHCTGRHHAWKRKCT